MMKKTGLFLSVILVILLIMQRCGNRTSVPESFPEDSLLGEWYTIKGDVEAYSFLKDENSYIFTGTQGMRPVVYGTWKIENNMFVIVMDNGHRTEYTFSLNNDTLILNGGAEIYTRTEPFEVKHPEVKILLDIASDFKDLGFTAPEPGDINWGYYDENTLSIKEIQISGYSITAGSTLSSGHMSDISNYIKDCGYESDTIFVTEICNGYTDAGQLITLCAFQETEADNDSVMITVSSGIIK